MTTNELLNALLAWELGAVICSLDTETVPALRKTGNPFGTVTKRSHVSGVLNWQYEGAVNRQRTREGLEADFEALTRSWGQRIQGTPLVEHKGSHYLELKVQTAGQPTYWHNGHEVPAADVQPFLRKPSAGRQGVESQVILRDYALTSIRAITYGGTTMAVGAGK